MNVLESAFQFIIAIFILFSLISVLGPNLENSFGPGFLSMIKTVIMLVIVLAFANVIGRFR